MTGDDAAVAIDQNRVGPAEGADRGGDLRHLGVRVGARVAGIRDQALQRPVGHRQLPLVSAGRVYGALSRSR